MRPLPAPPELEIETQRSRHFCRVGDPLETDPLGQQLEKVLTNGAGIDAIAAELIRPPIGDEAIAATLPIQLSGMPATSAAAPVFKPAGVMGMGMIRWALEVTLCSEGMLVERLRSMRAEVVHAAHQARDDGTIAPLDGAALLGAHREPPRMRL